MLWLVGLNPEVLSTVQRSSLGEVLGRERTIFNLELAVAKYLESSATGKARNIAQHRGAADLRLDVCCTVFVITGRPITLSKHKTVGAALIGPY